VAATWKHPKLGTFEFDYGLWNGIVKAPGFDAFAYDTGRKNSRPPKGKYKLAMEPSGENGPPAKELVLMALRVLADPPALSEIIVNAL